MTDEFGREYLTIEKKEILYQTELYYQGEFQKCNSNFDLLDKQWKKQYSPKKEIHSSRYDEIEKEILIDELEEILQDLPNDKVAGPSKIK